MRSLGKAGFAVSVAALALAWATPGESAAPPVAPVTAAEANTTSAPSSGGWTRQGWSDDAAPPRADIAPAEEMAPPRQDLVPPADPSGNACVFAAPRWPDRDDWRRQTWDGGQGNAFRYRRGERLPDAFAAPAYVVRDWRGYGLPAPGPTRDWIRYYDDAVLVDRYGTVVHAIPGVRWDRPVAGYAGQAYPAYQADPVYGVASSDPRYGTAYDTGECRRAADGGFLPGTCTHHAADGAVTVTTTTAPVITTHTTVVNRPVPAAKRRVVPARKRAARPAR